MSYNTFFNQITFPTKFQGYKHMLLQWNPDFSNQSLFPLDLLQSNRVILPSIFFKPPTLGWNSCKLKLILALVG